MKLRAIERNIEIIGKAIGQIVSLDSKIESRIQEKLWSFEIE